MKVVKWGDSFEGAEEMKKHDPPKPVTYAREILPVANYRPACREMAQFQNLRLSDTHYGIPSPSGSELTDIAGNEA